ncbi:YfhD family protein [Niallia endozanthoxylica]|nr:YfhD family protein [Niallia endozanthoxylica]
MAKQNNYQNNLKSDGVDEEFSMELADKDDLEAQARADAANQRAAKRKNK